MSKMRNKQWEECPHYSLILEMINNPQNDNKYILEKIEQLDCEFKDFLIKKLKERKVDNGMD